MFKKVFIILLVVATTASAILASSPPQFTEITNNTSTTLTVTWIDSLSYAGKIDSIGMFDSTDSSLVQQIDINGADSVVIQRADSSVANSYTMTGLTPATQYDLIVGVYDSVADGWLYTATADTEYTLNIQIIEPRRPDLTIPGGTFLEKYSFDPPAGTSSSPTFTIKGSGADSTGVYFSAGYHNALMHTVQADDSVGVIVILMAGYNDETTQAGPFYFEEVDRDTLTAAGDHFVPWDGTSPGNVVSEHFYYVFQGLTMAAGNDSSSGAVITPRAIRED